MPTNSVIDEVGVKLVGRVGFAVREDALRILIQQSIDDFAKWDLSNSGVSVVQNKISGNVAFGNKPSCRLVNGSWQAPEIEIDRLEFLVIIHLWHDRNTVLETFY